MIGPFSFCAGPLVWSFRVIKISCIVFLAAYNRRMYLRTKQNASTNVDVKRQMSRNVLVVVIMFRKKRLIIAEGYGHTHY